MGEINDKYKNKIEQSVLMNGHPFDNHDIIGGRLIIKPEGYSRPEISEREKSIILEELASDLKHYGLEVIDLNKEKIKVKSGDFEIVVPKNIVIPYDDDIFAKILKQQQEHYSNQKRAK